MIRLFPGEFKKTELKEKYSISKRYNLLLRSSGYSYNVLSINLSDMLLWIWNHSNKFKDKYIPLSVIKTLNPILIHGQSKTRFGGAWFGGQKVEKPNIISSGDYTLLTALYPDHYLSRDEFLTFAWYKFITHLYINDINILFRSIKNQIPERGDFIYYNT